MLLAESPFLNRARWVSHNEHAVAIRDAYPVSLGHTLIVPRRVVSSLFDLTTAESNLLWALLRSQRAYLLWPLGDHGLERIPDGFTVGLNDGVAAGQTVLHAHVHLIPRYHGDIADPRGGVRGVIPGKALY